MNKNHHPTICPKCGESRIVRVLWKFFPLLDEKEKDVRTKGFIFGNSVHGNLTIDEDGKAPYIEDDFYYNIDPGQINMCFPFWICLACEPRWSDVHRMAGQDYEWESQKEEAVASKDFEEAGKILTKQEEFRPQLTLLVEELLENWRKDSE